MSESKKASALRGGFFISGSYMEYQPLIARIFTNMTYAKAHYNLPQRAPRTRRKAKRKYFRDHRRSSTFIKRRLRYADRPLPSSLRVLRVLGGEIMLNLRKS